MTPKITVYTKRGCVQCDLTKKAFDRAGVIYETRDPSKDKDALEVLANLGYQGVPVVTVETPGRAMDHWYGFIPAKIGGYTVKAA
jgi:glutaredoxin-like protein NrdH